jgi:hypothetical protein
VVTDWPRALAASSWVTTEQESKWVATAVVDVVGDNDEGEVEESEPQAAATTVDITQTAATMAPVRRRTCSCTVIAPLPVRRASRVRA